MTNSASFQLNKEDLIKVGKGALIALGGALLTYAATAVNLINFGAQTPTIVAILSILINLAYKFLRNNQSDTPAQLPPTPPAVPVIPDQG